jgi:hypothetical protein
MNFFDNILNSLVQALHITDNSGLFKLVFVLAILALIVALVCSVDRSMCRDEQFQHKYNPRHLNRPNMYNSATKKFVRDEQNLQNSNNGSAGIFFLTLLLGLVIVILLNLPHVA